MKDKIKKYWLIVKELAIANLKMRDQGTFLGFIWTLLHPLIYYLVLYELFVKWMGRFIPEYSLYLIIGIIQWNYFASGTMNSISVIIANGNYIKSIQFPKSSLVFSSVLTTMFTHVFELFVLVIFWLVIGKSVSWNVLMLIPLLMLSVYLVTGISFLLSTVGVYFLDIMRIWGIFMNVGMFVTPVFYTLDLLTPGKKAILMLNPMTHIIAATREILMHNKMPDWYGLMYVFVLATVILAAGLIVFKRNEKYFIEKI